VRSKDLVRFVNPRSEAGHFCKAYDLSLCVVEVKKICVGCDEMAIVDAGLGYDIYAFLDELEIVVESSLVPMVSEL
jgi:hypothetical protein